MARGYSQRTNFKCANCGKHEFTKYNMHTFSHLLVCGTCFDAIPWVRYPLYRVIYRTSRKEYNIVVKCLNEKEVTEYVVNEKKAKVIVSITLCESTGK